MDAVMDTSGTAQITYVKVRSTIIVLIEILTNYVFIRPILYI